MKKSNLLGMSLLAVGAVAVSYMLNHSSSFKGHTSNASMPIHAGIGGTWSADMPPKAMRGNFDQMKKLLREGSLTQAQIKNVRAQLLSNAIVNSMTADGKLSDSELLNHLQSLESEGFISIAD